MGNLLDKFSEFRYSNEAEVSQDMIIILLTEFLGYDRKEIIPEKNYPAKKFYSGVKEINGSKQLSHKPDYVICLDGNFGNTKFIIDSKGPSEDIDRHLPQLRSYALSVGVNLLIITNGNELKIFDVNEPIFVANSINEIDYKFDELFKILGRHNQATKSLKEILISIDEKISLNKSDEDYYDEELTHKKNELSDFKKYLDNIFYKFKDWQNPLFFQGLNNLDIKGFNPELLHIFRIFQLSKPFYNGNTSKNYCLNDILQEFCSDIKIIIGETGIGKTSLLKYLTFRDCSSCLEFHSTTIPIYVELRNINNNTTLIQLIERELNLNNYFNDDFYKIVTKNHFILYLDAYDEIPDSQLSSFRSEILSFAGKCECIITTRERSIPNNIQSLQFSIEKLSGDKIKEISEYYLGNSYYNFLVALKNNDLLLEAGNILLLLFMISVFKEINYLPITFNRITLAVLDRFKEWDNCKHTDEIKLLTWDNIESLISEIAFALIENNKVYMEFTEVAKTINPIIRKLEESRMINIGMTIEQILSPILIKGIIQRNNEGIFFWHRIFLNYYASIALARKLECNIGLIDSIKHSKYYSEILPCSSSHMKDSTRLINALNYNIWMQGRCLLEANHVEKQIVDNIIDKLINRCNSRILLIRDRALTILTRQKTKSLTSLFWDLFKTNKYVDVKMTALEEIAKEKTEQAKQHVIKNLNWDETSGMWGRFSSLSIINALSEFGENEILKILDIWKNKPDIFTSDTCVNVFSKLFQQSKITNKIKDALYEFYFSNLQKDIIDSIKNSDVMKVLLLFNDDNYVDRLLNVGKDLYRKSDYDTLKLLENYNSGSAFKKILSGCKSTDKHYSYFCSSILINTKFNYELKDILDLFDNRYTKYNAIRSLKRFPLSHTKNEILKFLNSNFTKEHEAAMDALCEAGTIREIINDNSLPNYFTYFSVRCFLNAVKRYKIFESEKVLNKIYDGSTKINYDIRILFLLAQTYSSIGCEQNGINIIQEYYDTARIDQFSNSYDLIHLMEILPEFNKDFANKTLLIIFNNHYLDSNENVYFKEKYLEAVENIKTDELKETVKTIINNAINKLDRGEIDEMLIERPLRTLVRVGSPEDERYIIDLLDSDRKMSNTDLQRALSFFVIFGTDSCIPLLKKIAFKYRNNDHILNICYDAYEAIQRRKGSFLEIREEELLPQ